MSSSCPGPSGQSHLRGLRSLYLTYQYHLTSQISNKLKSLKVAKSKDDDVVCDVMYDSVCDVVCGDVVCDVVCDVVYFDAVW